ncbi:leucine-rich repeat domain-containing protein [Clostridioides mangenotii]|uniref:leucine-rich repeat domain-containing protein n=1 Tax=Metaclostridioides mangenotii TaxID=1540 RepID=UPI00214A3B17|nr:leucine-rich repeat domain-containing protein [Clostridioides mangenotii]MCR1954299.1 leucine-rich repeat domain-containing protein [Clostridioides mangenotii]
MNKKCKKVLSLCMTVLLLSVSTLPANSQASKSRMNTSNNSQSLKETVVDVKDPALKAALIEEVGDPITKEKLSGIYQLDLSEKNITNIQELQFCTSLYSLFLNSNQISDISALENLTSLHVLYLNSNQISDISALKNLTSLEALYLNSNQISDISALKNLTSIDVLSLESNQISDISALKNLTSLYALYMDFNQVSDISPLEGFKYLTYLFMTANQINDISALKYSTSLESLQLISNQISDISALKNLTSLREIYLDSNQITDISSLKDLKSLQTLDLGSKLIPSKYSNQISDISALKDLTSLREIYLDSNQLTDISTLKNLTSLEFLDLDSNQISDISALKDLTNISNFTAKNQKINLDPVIFQYNQSNGYHTESPITVLNGGKLASNEINNIIPTGNYDGNGKIAWPNLDKSGTVGILKYNFDSHVNLASGAGGEFTGIVEQDYEIKGKSNTPPVVIGAQDKTIYVGDTYDPKDGVSATDNEDGVLTDKIQISGDTVDTNKAGVYNITYSVTDSDNNTTTKTIILTVKKKSGGGGGGGVNPPAPSSDTVILASGEKYTDVLTATVLGNEKDAPILLSQKDKVDDKTIAEIKRLNTENIIISGGKDSVSSKVEEQLKDFNVTRIAGQDRFETAEKIGNEVRKTGNKDGAMLVDGTSFPDVITMSSLASQKRVPILLTNPQTFTNTTKETIKSWGVNDVTIGGGYNSVSKDIEDKLEVSRVNRFGGDDRYKTAELIGDEVRKVTGNKDDMILVDGTDFPDGITINSLAAHFMAPIMLTEPYHLNSTTSNDIKKWSIKNILIGGGYNSVSKEIEDNLGVNNEERVAGQDRYETAVKISERLSQISKVLGSK